MPCTLVDCADVRLHNAVLRTMPLHCRYTWRTETEADYAAKIDGWVRSLTSQVLVMRSLTSQVLVMRSLTSQVLIIIISTPLS